MSWRIRGAVAGIAATVHSQKCMRQGCHRCPVHITCIRGILSIVDYQSATTVLGDTNCQLLSGGHGVRADLRGSR